MKKLFIFDLDGTLALSKQTLSREMAETLCKLLSVAQVAVISGASFGQFHDQFISQLPCEELFPRLHILPTNGASYRVYETKTGEWDEIYDYALNAEDKQRIIKALHEAIAESGIEMPVNLYGEQIEDRGSQITFSALGQQAPLAKKQVWDPDTSKRQTILKLLAPKIPEYKARLGGTTTIDVTREGIGKGSACLSLIERLGFYKSDTVYVGDAVFPGGNDYAAVEVGLEVRKVRGPEETRVFLEEYLNNK